MKRYDLNRSIAMLLAWRIYRSNNGQVSFGQCMVSAWKVLRLNAALQEGLVRFTFQKVNGEVREAVGTLKADLFVATPPKATDRPEFMTLVRYYDVEKNAIRSFRAERLIQVAA
jgi:hypothetical protein